MFVAFYRAFGISNEVVCLQRCLVVTCLVPGDSSAVSGHVLYTPYHHAPVYSVTLLAAAYVGCVCVFSCNLLPALLEIKASSQQSRKVMIISLVYTLLLMLQLPPVQVPDDISPRDGQRHHHDTAGPQHLRHPALRGEVPAAGAGQAGGQKPQSRLLGRK